jgi:hypothetical protein
MSTLSDWLTAHPHCPPERLVTGRSGRAVTTLTAVARASGGPLSMTMRPQKITFGEMREMGVRGVLIYCADYHCSRSVALNADRWADDVRLSDIESRFVCAVCGQRCAEVRPDFGSIKKGAHS